MIPNQDDVIKHQFQLLKYLGNLILEHFHFLKEHIVGCSTSHEDMMILEEDKLILCFLEVRKTISEVRLHPRIASFPGWFLPK